MNNSVSVSDLNVGKRYAEGLFLGYFDLKNGIGSQPIFVTGLTQRTTFDGVMAEICKLPDGYEEKISIGYDAFGGLRKSQTVFAPTDMVLAAHKNKEVGGFKEFLNGVEEVFSSTPHSDINCAWYIDVKSSKWYWNYGRNIHAHGLVVRAGMERKQQEAPQPH